MKGSNWSNLYLSKMGWAMLNPTCHTPDVLRPCPMWSANIPDAVKHQKAVPKCTHNYSAKAGVISGLSRLPRNLSWEFQMRPYWVTSQEARNRAPAVDASWCWYKRLATTSDLKEQLWRLWFRFLHRHIKEAAKTPGELTWTSIIFINSERSWRPFGRCAPRSRLVITSP